MADTYTQIDHDGPQHIDGAAPPPVSIPVTVGTVSKAMPPQDVMEAAMLLTEACNGWTAAGLQKPIAHNQSYVLHQDLCSLATDPVGFNDKLDDVFGYGMFAAVILMVLLWALFNVFMWAVNLFSRQKKRSAETLKARLIVEAAKRKVDEINSRSATGAAE